MASLILSYHEIMPQFVDQLTSFGESSYPQDLHSIGFREERHIESIPRTLQVGGPKNPASEIQFCYNLKAVERFPRSKDNTSFSWSIRQAAVYHKFRFDSGKSVWVIIKEDELIMDKLSRMTEKWEKNRFNSLPQALT